MNLAMDNSTKKDVWKNQSLYERLCKSLQFDGYNQNSSNKNNNTSYECVSTLPLTEVTVNLVEKTIITNKKRLGKLDINYASFILHQACLSPTSVILAMIYLDRLKKFNSEYLVKMTSSELFLASLIVASKFLFDKGDDEMVYNDEWASFANLDLNDLNKLERDFLDALQWSCFVDQETFMEQVVKYEGLISMNEYSKRRNNSMTYLEMISFFKYLKHFHDKDNQLIWTNIRNIFQSILICTAAYFIAIGIILVSSSVIFTLQSHILFSHNSNEPGNMNISSLSIIPLHKVTFSKELKFSSKLFSNENITTIKFKQKHNYHDEKSYSQHLFFRSKYVKC